MKIRKQAGLFSAPTPKSPLSSFSQASKTMTNDILAKYSAPLPKNALQSAVNFGIMPTQSQKTTAEPENSNDLSLANNSAPCAFFIRSLRTSKERLNQACSSMVACSGKGFALCCVPVIAVSQPVTRYRPKPENFQAVTSENLFTGAIAMIYQFLGVSRQHYDRTKAEQIRILADNEQQARAYLARDYVLILLGKLPNSAKNDRTLEIKGGIYA